MHLGPERRVRRPPAVRVPRLRLSVRKVGYERADHAHVLAFAKRIPRVVRREVRVPGPHHSRPIRDGRLGMVPTVRRLDASASGPCREPLAGAPRHELDVDERRRDERRRLQRRLDVRDQAQRVTRGTVVERDRTRPHQVLHVDLLPLEPREVELEVVMPVGRIVAQVRHAVDVSDPPAELDDLRAVRARRRGRRGELATLREGAGGRVPTARGDRGMDVVVDPRAVCPGLQSRLLRNPVISPAPSAVNAG